MPRTPRPHARTGARTRAAALAAGVAASAIALAGCNIVAPVFYAVHGPGKVEAAYELPNRPTVILVDDPGSRVSQRRLRAQIGDVAQRYLLEKKVLTDMVDTRAALALASQPPPVGEKPMSVAAIGRNVEAEVVIYVVLKEFLPNGTAPDYSPRVTMDVKVLDALAGERLWPGASVHDPGFTFTLNIPTRPGRVQNPTTTADALARESELATLAGRGLAQLFHTVEVTESVRAGMSQ